MRSTKLNLRNFSKTLELKKMTLVFRMLPKEISSEVFAFLESDTQEHIIIKLGDGQRAF